MYIGKLTSLYEKKKKKKKKKKKVPLIYKPYDIVIWKQ